MVGNGFLKKKSGHEYFRNNLILFGAGDGTRTHDVQLGKLTVLVFYLLLSIISTITCAPFTPKSAHISPNPLTNPLTTL